MAARGHAGAVWVEADCVHNSRVIVEALNQGFLAKIPQLDCAVIRARDYDPGVGRELSRADPVGVRWNRQLKPAVCHLPNFKSFVIGGGEQQLPVARKCRRFHWSRVRFENVVMRISRESVESPTLYCSRDELCRPWRRKR